LEAGHPFQLSKIVAMRNTPNCQCQEQKGKGQKKKGIWNRFVSPILVLYLLSFLFILILVVHNFNKDNKRELLASKRQMNRLYVSFKRAPALSNRCAHSFPSFATSPLV
jgi:hypothetical protein